MSEFHQCISSLRQWPRIRWVVTAFTSVVTFLLIGIPTDIIPNPIFGREIAVTSWSLSVLVSTSILSGLLLATYVAGTQSKSDSRTMKVGGAGTFLAYFAVGCPVCNKLALVALGYSGALQYFAPIQPYLAALSVALLFYAFRKRVLNEGSCRVKF
jgi:hypothetical protein